jgi:outer membrane lipase/esterase
MLNIPVIIQNARLAISSCLWILCALTPGIGQAVPFNQISQVYFFGDSLTDSGFNNLITIGAGIPNKAPTFTTYSGYTWSQYLARDIKGIPLATAPDPFTNPLTNNKTPLLFPSDGAVDPVLGGINYACGGSLTGSNPGLTITWAPSLIQQINYFLSTSPPNLDPNAIYFIWSGANDLLKLLSETPAPNQYQLLKTADTAAINIASQIAVLTNHGAKRIVVLALPNLGVTPFALETAALTNTPTVPTSLKNLSYLFNSRLNQRIGEIISQRAKGYGVLPVDRHSQAVYERGTGVSVLYFNTYSYVNEVLDYARKGLSYQINGESFFFANISDPVCGAGISALFCTSLSNNYFFADAVHPTDLAHRALSLAVENSIAAWG